MTLQPRVITKSDPSEIRIEWSDGSSGRASAKTLRDHCPCAHCVDEWTGAKRHDPASTTDTLETRDVAMVGHYALSISFSDGHATGIYPWKLLRECCAANG